MNIQSYEDDGQMSVFSTLIEDAMISKKDKKKRQVLLCTLIYSAHLSLLPPSPGWRFVFSVIVLTDEPNPIKVRTMLCCCARMITPQTIIRYSFLPNSVVLAIYF